MRREPSGARGPRGGGGGVAGQEAPGAPRTSAPTPEEGRERARSRGPTTATAAGQGPRGPTQAADGGRPQAGPAGLCAATVPILDPPRESRNQNPVPFTLPENTQRTIAPAMSAQPTLYL